MERQIDLGTGDEEDITSTSGGSSCTSSARPVRSTSTTRRSLVTSSFLSPFGEKRLHKLGKGKPFESKTTLLPRVYPPEWAEALTQERRQKIETAEKDGDSMEKELAYLDQLPKQKWEALCSFQKSCQWPYPPQHVGFVDPAVVDFGDSGEPSFPACWQFFAEDMEHVVKPGQSLYQAIKALIQLCHSERYSPFRMRLSQMFTHSYGRMDQYGDIIQRFSECSVDLTDFDSFPWAEAKTDAVGEAKTVFEEAVAVARALHYYINLGFRRVSRIASEQAILAKYPGVRDMFLVSEQHWNEASKKLAQNEDEPPSVSQTEAYLSHQKQDWESWFINPGRVGLGINNAMSYACYDRTTKKWRYDYGEWVEIRNYKMKWRLTQVTERLQQTMNDKVVRSYDTNSDWDEILESDRNVSIPFQKELGCRACSINSTVPHVETEQVCIRLPQEALTRIYGIGPWIWQRWALLQVEMVLRFESRHRDDYENLDILEYAMELWSAFVYHKDNKAFREVYETAGASGQEELLRHVMDPFTLMHSVIHNSEKWDFDSVDASVFLYTAMLGAGFFDAFLVILAQIMMPVMLYFFYTDEARNTYEDPDDLPKGTRLMLALALFYYFYKIASDLRVTFGGVLGSNDSIYSKIMSIRRLAWNEGFETVAQTVGFIFEVGQNSGYLALLYLFNIFVLYNSEDAFEILGNVVLFEFVYSLDESVASSAWYDDGRRYLKAGTVEMILQIFIRGREMMDIDTFVDYFADFVGRDSIGSSYLVGIKEKLRSVVEMEGVSDTFLHQPYDDEPSDLDDLLPLSQRIRFNLMDSYGPNPSAKKARFGPSGFSCIPNRREPIFQKHCHYRCWRLWSKVLFVAPPINERSDFDNEAEPTEADEEDRTKRNFSTPFPWNRRGPIIPRSFISPGTLELHGFAYPSSSEFCKRYTEFKNGDRSLVLKRRSVFSFRYWHEKASDLVETDKGSKRWKVLARIVFNMVALLSWSLLYIFLPAVLFLSFAAISPVYCVFNVGFQYSSSCWGF